MVVATAKWSQNRRETRRSGRNKFYLINSVGFAEIGIPTEILMIFLLIKNRVEWLSVAPKMKLLLSVAPKKKILSSVVPKKKILPSVVPFIVIYCHRLFRLLKLFPSAVPFI